ncbi:MAG: hypothetical protein QOE97_2070 [Pseudonocardiales bacterium]|jgi:hypothetical protein|nr:hypothetical protein [Pseudonocardiales bacterium]
MSRVRAAVIAAVMSCLLLQLAPASHAAGNGGPTDAAGRALAALRRAAVGDVPAGHAVATPGHAAVHLPTPSQPYLELRDGAGAAVRAPAPRGAQATTAGSTPLYVDTAGHSATAFEPVPGGARQLFVLLDRHAPSSVSVPIELPSGAGMVADGAGGYGADGACVKVKSTLQVSEYRGGYCR